MPLKLVPSRDRKLHGAFQAADARALVRGTYLFRVGEPATEAFLVTDGQIQLRVPRRRSRPARTVAVVGPGELCGTAALERDGRYRYGARAGRQATVRALPASRFRSALSGTRWTLGLLFAAANADLAMARSLIGGPSGHRTSGRLSHVLLDLGRRFGTPGIDDPRAVLLPRWFTHQDLADLAGAHRSTVTTQVNEWIYEDVLREAPEGLVLDVDALSRAADT